MKDLTNEEIAFIEDTLEYQDNLELSKDLNKNDSSDYKVKTVSAPIKKQKHRVPAYKNPAHWAAAFMVAPILFSALLMFLLFRVEAMFGSGTLEWLANDPTGKEVKDAAAGMGFEWVATVATIYDNRWLIVAAIFTLFFFIAMLVILYDNFFSVKIAQWKRNKKLVKNKRKNKRLNKNLNSETTPEEDNDDKK